MFYVHFYSTLTLTTTIIILMIGKLSTSNVDTLALFQLTNCPGELEHRCQIASQIEAKYRFLKNNNTIDARLCTMNVGNDDLEVLDMMLTILETGRISLTKGTCINETVQFDFVLAQNPILFVYVSHETTRLISSLLSIDETDSILLVAITHQAMYPNVLMERVTFIYSYEMSYAMEMHKQSLMHLKSYFEISYVAFLFLKELEQDEFIIKQPCDMRKETAFCLYVAQDKFQHQNCYKEKIMSRRHESYHDVLTQLMDDPHLRTIVVYGYGPSVVNFRSYLDLHYTEFYYMPFTRTITNSSIDDIKFNKFYWLDKFPGQNSVNGILQYIYFYKRDLFTDFQIFKALRTRGLLEGFRENYGNILKLFGVNISDEFTFEEWRALGDIPLMNKVITNFVTSWDNVKEFLKYWKAASYMSLLEPERLLNSTFMNPTTALQAGPYCRLAKPICLPGRY